MNLINRILINFKEFACMTVLMLGYMSVTIFPLIIGGYAHSIENYWYLLLLIPNYLILFPVCMHILEN